MATVTKGTNSWNVDVSPGEEMTLTMAQTYVDRDINVRAMKISDSDVHHVTIKGNMGKANQNNSVTLPYQPNKTGCLLIAFSKIYAGGPGDAAKPVIEYVDNLSKNMTAVSATTIGHLGEGQYKGTVKYSVSTNGTITFSIDRWQSGVTYDTNYIAIWVP